MSFGSDYILVAANRLLLAMKKLILVATLACAAVAQRPTTYSVTELSFRGPMQTAKSSPAREVELQVSFRHPSGVEHTVHGFWDGGDIFKVRFTPTRPGRWTVAAVTSNVSQLNGQREGESIEVAASKLHGFWLPDPQSAGKRWYMRSDGSHQYVVGNTHYSYLSETNWDGKPHGSTIVKDTAANAKYFRKLRFSPIGDLYPHPQDGPFLDAEGKPTYNGDYSHRPNPDWFRKRTDVAVQTALEGDLIADLILAGVDTEAARSSLRARHNVGDATPFLRYMAARYGSYPNVWMCIVNEYDIRTPRWSPEEIIGFARTLKRYLTYDTPISVHRSSSVPWLPAFNTDPPWNDHVIIQRKIRNIADSADALQSAYIAGGSRMPVLNDELSYEGEGDTHSEQDTIESHLGTFLGGGYGTTGHKRSGPRRELQDRKLMKTGQYFVGNFDPAEHTSSDNLAWLRQVIDREIRFWTLQPGIPSIFSGLDAQTRGMSSEGNEYVIGTNKAQTGMSVQLPRGQWTVTMHDAVSMQSKQLGAKAKGTFSFVAPNSRAVLFHFRRNGK